MIYSFVYFINITYTFVGYMYIIFFGLFCDNNTIMALLQGYQQLHVRLMLLRASPHINYNDDVAKTKTTKKEKTTAHMLNISNSFALV